jgi:hypothetical protein
MAGTGLRNGPANERWMTELMKCLKNQAWNHIRSSFSRTARRSVPDSGYSSASLSRLFRTFFDHFMVTDRDRSDGFWPLGHWNFDGDFRRDCRFFDFKLHGVYRQCF